MGFSVSLCVLCGFIFVMSAFLLSGSMSGNISILVGKS